MTMLTMVRILYRCHVPITFILPYDDAGSDDAANHLDEDNCEIVHGNDQDYGGIRRCCWASAAARRPCRRGLHPRRHVARQGAAAPPFAIRHILVEATTPLAEPGFRTLAETNHTRI
ncbi:hypothetical protein N9L68_03585 [bacterium]|nr:hypothetical protein [bacterium]